MFRMLKAMMWPLPISPSRFSTGTLQSLRIERAGRRAADAHLVLFRADGEAREVPLHQKRGELLAVHLREDGEQVGEAGVGDPHLFAVEDVVLAVGESLARARQFSASEPEEASDSAYAPTISPAASLRQIFLLLLFGAEVDDGQRADAGMCAPGGGEAGILGDVIRDHGGGDLVHLEAAVGLGNLDAAQAQVARLLQQVARDGEVLVFDLLDVGQDFVDGEFFRGLADQPVLLGEVLRSEDLVELALFEQKAAAGNPGAGNCSCGCH